MRASRLLSVLLLLQTRGRMTAEELAAELEVSVRTVYRDLESLGVAGVPVYADRGPGGGYELLAGYRTDLTGLSMDEAGALAFAAMPDAAAEVGLATALATAERKVLAALPEPVRAHASLISERFHVDAPGWLASPDPAPHLPALAAAVWDEHVVWVRYLRWRSEEVIRVVHPLGLVVKSGVWYLVAGRDEDVRTYRVSRVLGLQRRAGRVQRPEGFDLAAYWREWSTRFAAEVYGARARVRVSPRGQALLAGMFGPLGSQALATAAPPEPDGWVTVTLAIESIDQAVLDLLHLGPDAEVLAPPQLRAAVAAAAEAITAHYR